MQNFVIEIMDRFGYPGIGFLILIENLFPPIPSEVILTFGGFMTTYTTLTIPLTVLTATAASTAGALLLYCLGSLLNHERLSRLMDTPLCRHLGFKKDEILSTLAWFDLHGRSAVFFGRCVPIIRSLISIPAGMASMPLLPFTLYTFAGSLVWNTVLICLGALAGSSWKIITNYLSAYSSLALIVLSTAAVTGLIFLLRRRKTRDPV